MDVNSQYQTAPLHTFMFDHLYTLRRMHTSRMYMRYAIPPIAGDMRTVRCSYHRRDLLGGCQPARGSSACWEGVCPGRLSGRQPCGQNY